MSRSRALLILALGTLILIVGALLLYTQTSRVLTVTFLDVGQGDAIFIQSPTGVQVLVDGGRDARVLQRLASVMDPWDREIDVVVGTHPDADHIGGLDAVLERYRVKAVVDPGVSKETGELTSFVETAQEEGALLYRGQAGDSIDIGGGAKITVLAPKIPIPSGDANAASIVLLLSYGGTTVLLTGDAPSDVEEELVAQGLVPDVDILKAGHHGSHTSTSDVLLKAAHPEVVVYSVGSNNRYGHPHPEVRRRVQALGARERRTDEEGSITFVSNGRVWQGMDI